MWEAISEFYRNLYKGAEGIQEEEVKEYCEILEKTVCKEEVEELEEEVTAQELLGSVKTMAANKTPGSDGLPVEFFVKFWTLVEVPLLEVIKFCLAGNCISKSMQEGIITLNLKKGDLKELKN